MTHNSSSLPTHSPRPAAVAGNRLVYWHSRHWLLFSLGLVGWLFPRLEASFGDAAHQIESKFQQAGVGL